ncbi:glycoside hydrolase family 32 protein [Aliiglaciecola litoralis]|uniref:Glycoside hydrolase family 32 protein n=1 Tax=Aliiglaciecola litoralis TaxID=582857 RepID=A0ABN1LD20_9ALTE
MSLDHYVSSDVDPVTTSPEKYRPHYHYTARKGWLSDPNGMVYFDGEFHLFYQHDDYVNVFGAMSWGHAVSKDLLHWQELPKAIIPDEHLGMCFSGCMVVDKNNSSGLSKNTLVGFYTSELPKQQQSMFYSLDNGRTFRKYNHNPVIPNSAGMSKDFRDPKVFWYEEQSLWIMALAGPERIEFWSSTNLIDWQLQSWFGEGHGAHEGEWECPDLRYMPIDGDSNNCVWVLIVSVNPGGPNGGSGTQYFIGDFLEVDGKLRFITKQTDVKWLDWGSDNYAGVGWTNLQDSSFGNRVFSIGWMNNWTYAYKTPTNQWRGTMTMIRELKLETFYEELVLTCCPAPIYKELVGDELANLDNVSLNKPTNIGSDLSASRIQIDFDTTQTDHVCVELSNTLGQLTRIGYCKSDGIFYVDRRKSGNQDFAEGFSGIHIAKATRTYNTITMDIFIDRCSVEVFFNNGEYAMSELIFPEEPLSIFKPVAQSSINPTNVNIRKMREITRL